MKKAFAILFVIAIVALLVISGCAKQAATTTVKTTGASAQVSTGIDNVATTSQDVNTSDLDTLDKDLASVNW